MGKKKICNLIILDASGSMSNKADEVRHGLKELFKDIRQSSDVKNHTIVCDFASAGDFRILINSSVLEFGKSKRRIVGKYFLNNEKIMKSVL